jgi:hypothetical protein
VRLDNSEKSALYLALPGSTEAIQRRAIATTESNPKVCRVQFADHCAFFLLIETSRL